MARIGLIGLGGWGKNHARVLNELESLSCVCDVDESKVKLYSLRYKVKGYGSVNEMLDKEELDGVIIATPTSTHYNIGVKVIEYGINVFIEKPLTPKAEEGKKIIELAKKKDVILTVGYIERFNPAVMELKRLIDEGVLGKPLLLEFHRENKLPINIKDVGIIEDTSVHDIDTARWIFNQEPKMIFARTGKVFSDREDFATIILGFEEENTAFISSSWVTPKRVRQLVAYCTEGTATIDFITQEIRIDDEKGTKIPRRRWEEPLMIELKSFIDCIERKRKPLVSGEDALKNTIIAEAAIKSSRTSLPIHLNL